MFVARFLSLLALWLLLSGRFDLLHVGLGVVSAAVVALAAHSEVLADEKPSLRVVFQRAYRLLWYSAWLVLEIVKANVYVLSLAFSQRVTDVINPRIFTFKTTLDLDFAKYLFATSITLTPGTVTIRIIGDEVVIHAISDKAAVGLPTVMQEKLEWVFEE